MKQQAALLDRAAALDQAGRPHRLHHLLGARTRKTATRSGPLLAGTPDFSVEKPAEMAQALGERAYLFSRAALISDEGLLMTPRRTDTDGFFVSLLRRSS